MPKSKDAFRTISEVADWLEVQPHVLRFWESKFSQVRPVKRAGGRRYYRPQDMLLIGGIKQLLHDDGMTIKGVQKLLREKGVKEISALSRPIDEEDVVQMEDLKDPAPVTEADLIGDVKEDVKEDVAESAPTETPSAAAPAVSEEPAPVEAAVEETQEVDAPPEPASTEEPASKKPVNPFSDDAPGWEVRRKVIARLTEMSEIDPSKRAAIAAAVSDLAKVQARHQSTPNA
ncbi:MerR family transcriptional regulator [Cognatishimia activa]|uniref:MerR family regulatory protein n=1 Tax=Cognatishimia activa TaxID=1715691 RepID=A0A0P1IU83_9RHOB|nr:MerR family transcriptional regulator [Cognatishimia activa]CUJ32977.1 MerR family regulatory protein [Cognatishimia activa]CUK27127.1 MerR family regulatory protein [Cognatishimia activa]